MDQWLSQRLTNCLGFPVPDEMINFILSLKETHEIDDYFSTLLDPTIAEHRIFLNDFKQRLSAKNRPNSNAKVLQAKKTNVQTQQNKQMPKQKPPPAAADNSQSSKMVVESKKKPTKYVNLYAQDGSMNDVVLLKGRHMCNCQAAKHTLVNNCIQCGRIVCEQEGSGPCLFCGNLVCTEDEQKVIESLSKKGDNLKKSLMQQQRPKGWEEAVAMRNRLIDYDRTSEKRTTVIDDESDYFKTNSVWLSDTERAKLKRLEDEMQAKKHASRRSQKITIDFAGRQVTEEPQVTAEYEAQMLREIADAHANDNNGMYGTFDASDEQYDNIDLCHPLLNGPPPIFDDSVADTSADPNRPRFDGVYNRVQDKELLEVSDLRKCISMHQPWASLLVAGIKKHEGRPWYTSHRGRLWVASTAKPVEPESIKYMEEFYRKHYKDNSIEFPKQYPSGCLLGCVLLQDCLPQEEYRKIHPNGESDSPFVFICSDPQELPVRFPNRGEHKIYKLDESIHIAAVKALQRAAKVKMDN